MHDKRALIRRTLILTNHFYFLNKYMVRHEGVHGKETSSNKISKKKEEGDSQEPPTEWREYIITIVP